MKKKFHPHLMLIILLSVFTFRIQAQDYIQKFSEGSFVNWTKNEICATGYALIAGDPNNPENKIQAYRAACLDGMRRLLEVIHGINVDSETRVEDYAVADDTVKTKISGIVKNFSERSKRYLNGTCEVDISVPLYGKGALSDVLLGGSKIPSISQVARPVEKAKQEVQKEEAVKLENPSEEIKKETDQNKNLQAESDPTQEVKNKELAELPTPLESTVEATPTPSQETPTQTIQETTPAIPQKTELAMNTEEKSEETSSPVQLASLDKTKMPEIIPAQPIEEPTPAQQKDKRISGLVIDVSGHPVKPVLNPKIVSDTGEELYGFDETDRDFRKVNGIASYVSDVEDAQTDDRVSKIPYVITAKGVDEKKPSNVIISSEEAQKFKEVKGSQIILNHCRVIIVTNPAKIVEDSKTVTDPSSVENKGTQI